MSDGSRPTDAAPAAQASQPGVCVVCQCTVETGETATACPSCGATYHAECWTYNGGCGVYGCTQAAPTERLTDLEIPASHWGSDKKDCPSCAETILAAARRCTYCGAVFSSASPQGSAAYETQQKLQASRPSVKKWGIALLVFALIPCTAPFAAMVGAIWLLANWKSIQSLPPAIGAVGKIAVGIAWLQTLLLVGAAFLNFTLNR